MTTPAALTVLRSHVQVLAVAFGDKGAAALATLRPDFKRLMPRLARAAGCPDIDTLAPALQVLEQLRNGLDAIHGRRAVTGIARLRKALDGVEHFIEHVLLVAVGVEPAPNELLDIPQDGVLARILSGKRAPRRQLPRTLAGGAKSRLAMIVRPVRVTSGSSARPTKRRPTGPQAQAVA